MLTIALSSAETEVDTAVFIKEFFIILEVLISGCHY